MMPRDVATDDEWEDDWDGDEYIPENDDDEPTIPCPHCQEPIHEEAQRCPHCGHYVSEEDAPPSRKPWWIVLGAILCLFAVYLWVMK
jgi:uncharacterized paraquat-inducible protein A